MQRIRGVIKEISDPIIMERTDDGKKSMRKVTITLITTDGQRIYMDLINAKIKALKEQNIKVFSAVEVNYSFKGTNSGNKKYNNIFVNSIKHLKVD